MIETPQLRATAEEFERLLRGEEVKLSSEGGKDFKALRNDEWNKNITISNLKVEGDVYLKNEYPYFIRLIGNTILENVFICADAKVEGVLISDQTKTGDFKIYERAQTRGFSIINEAQTGYFHFLNQTRSLGFEIQNNAKVKGLNLLGETCVSHIKLTHNSELGNTKIADKAQIAVDGFFKICDNAKTGYIVARQNANLRQLRISVEAQTGPIEISGMVQIKEFSIDHSSNVSDIYILQQAEIREFIIKGEATVRDLSISGNGDTRIDSIKIEGNTHFKGISIERILSESIYLRGANINRQCEILNSKVDQIEIRGSNQIIAEKISIKSVSFRILNFIDFQFNNPVEITRLEPFEKTKGFRYIELSRSFFSKLILNNNSFQKLDFLVFESSDITNSVITQTKFPEHIQSSDPETGDFPYQSLKTVKDKFQAKLFYEQLKTTFNGQGNRTESIIYQAKELDIHYFNLSWKGDFKDKFSLWFHRRSTYFGTNWFKGFYQFVTISILLYTLILWSTERVTWTWPWMVNLSDLSTYTFHFFEFINPTKNLLGKWDYIYVLEGIDPKDPNDHLSGYLGGLLFGSKFILVILYYQIIQAFRRLGK